jgi:hypothetical protein
MFRREVGVKPAARDPSGAAVPLLARAVVCTLASSVRVALRNFPKRHNTTRDGSVTHDEFSGTNHLVGLDFPG